MRSTTCEDGNRRILAKIGVHLGATQIADYALMNPQVIERNEPEVQLSALNKRQLFALAKLTIQNGGLNATNTIDTQWPADTISNVRNMVSILFPEVD